MKSLITLNKLACAASFAWFLSGNVNAAPAEIKLPGETAKLRSAPLAGYPIAAQKCGICHSADYIEYQPPEMTKMQWTAEAGKMQHIYGAPLSDDDIKLVGIYLAATYGDQGTVTEEDKAAKPMIAVAQAASTQSQAANAIDVQALLTSNGCLGCHALDHKVVGPAYHDVASKYKTDPKALANIAASIRDGGSGKWGAISMPAFPALHETDARALAAYVLSQ